jgi:hypothetical protein
METDYVSMSGGELMQECGDSARKWAAAFMQHIKMRKFLPCEIDEGLMIGWFANAIETACDVRTRETDNQSTEGTND